MWRKGKKLTTVARLWALDQLQNPEKEPDEAQPDSAAQALAAFGLVAESAVAPRPAVRKAYIWPEHETVWRLWQACQTQWRDGLNGKTGLDYGGVAVVMHKRFRLRGAQEKECFELLQAMEISALNAWAEQRDNHD